MSKTFREPKWAFNAIQVRQDGQIEKVGLSRVQHVRIEKYIAALEAAASSTVANPIFSRYFVRESVIPTLGEIVPAGNIEYGFCQALHGEEAVMAAYRSRFGRSTQDVIIGIIAGSPGNIATPCGNCRDILLDDLGTDFEIVSGAADGGEAIVANMSHYLFSWFKTLSTIEIHPDLHNLIGLAIQHGDLLVNDAFSPKDVHPERRYHALIVTKVERFVGAHDVMCDYHPIYALRDAIRQARRKHDPFVQLVVIVCRGSGEISPHVMYKDRQHLLELNLQAELLAKEENDPPVFLATYDDERKVTGLWQTSVKQWLPLPFTSRNFGQEHIESLAKYYKGLSDN
ncbi:hypothetical protein HY771_00845 [Candidatus Uhrbacteria bacterium]|nr:hypothetical protein [Candidatus Uhrbacteria bacterium]